MPFNRGILGKYASTSSISGIVTAKEQFTLAAGGFYPRYVSVTPSEVSPSGVTPTISRLLNLLVKTDGSNGGDNTSIVDSSTNSHTITLNGDTQTSSFSPYDPDGYSTYFTDDGRHLEIDVGTVASSTAFTLEFWVKMNDLFTEKYAPFDWGGHNASGHLAMFAQPDGVLGFYGIALNNYNTGYNGVWDRKWHHICIQRAANGVGQTFFDGVVVQTFVSNVAVGNDGSLKINGLQNYTGYGTSNYVRDFRIVSGAQVYNTSGFIPPTSPLTAISGTILLTCHLPYIADGSTNNNSITITGDVRTTPLSVYRGSVFDADLHGGSVYFDGTDDYLDAGDIQFGANDFTIEGWFYFNSTANQCLLGRFHNYSSNQCWELIYEDGMRFQTNTGSFNSGLASFSVKINQWYHIAAVRSGSNKYLFINGILQSGYPINIGTGALQGESTGTVKIGTRHDLTKDFNGYMSDVRFVTGTAVYTSNFTPPTSPLTAVSNTSLLIKGNESAIYDATGFTTMALNGNTTTSTAVTKYASSSIYFDGSGDNINIIEDLPSLSGDFTIEFWVNFSTVQNCDFFGGATNTLMYIDYYEGYLRLGDYGGVYNVRGSWTPSTSTWYHIAAVRNNGTTTLFVDGTELASAADTYSYAAGSYNIGYHVNGYFHGYIEDFRITKELVRYPFLAPQETLTAVTGTSLLVAHDSSITDGSSSGHTITSAAQAAVSYFAPAIGMYSVAFDGTGDELTIADDASFKSFGTDNFTIECWCYPNTAGSGFGNYIWGDIASSGENNTGTTQCLFNSSSRFVAYVVLNNVATSITSSLTTPVKNWYHVALVRDGNTFTLFVNGAVAGTITSSTAVDTGTEVLAIGGPGAYDALRFNGYISNYRIVKGTALYSNSFTPPTAALT